MYASGSPCRRRDSTAVRSGESTGSLMRDHRSLHSTPIAWAARRSASARGDGDPASRRRSVASVIHADSVDVTRRSDVAIEGGHCVDEIVDLTVEDLLDPMHRRTDAVIGDAVLGEVVGAYLLGTVTRPHLRTTLGRQLRAHLFLGLGLEPRHEDTHRAVHVLAL